ncbi:MAG: sigma-70 family RNA polymerase sigma factor [Planctomycetes bacterium]|nr:sigma-70 family RNA polymerase sigma factor [Planctomycetota bacterium]
MHVTHPSHSADSGEDPTSRLLAEAGFVRRLARSLVRDAALADDVAQETMAAGLTQPVAPRSWRDWLATVARRLAGKSRVARRVREVHEAAAAARRPTRETDHRLELQRVLTIAVGSLTEPYRTVVTLRYFDDLPPRAIARRTGATADAVRQQLRRGLAMLRQRLDRDCGGRERWFGAFAAVGSGGVTVPLVPFVVLAMNKLALAAAAVLVAGGVIWMVSDPMASAPPVAPATDAVAPSLAATEVSRPDEHGAYLAREDALAALPKCEVVVLDSAGAPIEGAEVLICDARGESIEATTDADGVVAKAASGPGMVLARSAGHAPTWRSLDERTGRHVLTLGDGEVVGGVLLVDGVQAEKGTRLGVMLSSSLRHTGAPEGLEQWFDHRGPEEVLVGDNGRFRIQGLPEDLSGILWLPDDLWLSPDRGERPDCHDRVPLVARDDMTLRTTQLEVFEADVVWSDTQRLVKASRLRVRATFEDGSGTSGYDLDPRDGHFRIGLRPGDGERDLDWCDPVTRPKTARVWATASSPGSTGERTMRFERADLANGRVTIELDRAPCSHFVALDEYDRPIAGACVLTHHVSEPTDAEGRGTFDGTCDEVRLIGGPSHLIAAPTRPRGHGSAADPFVFVLPKDNPVVIHLAGANGGAPAADFVAVRCEQRPFAGRRDVSELDRKLYPYDPAGSTSGLHAFDVHWNVPRDGAPLTLHSFEPGATLTVALLDCMRAELDSRRVVVPPPEATSEVTLRESGLPFTVTGVIADEHGRTIPRAMVQMSASDPDATPHFRWCHAISDASGVFSVVGLHQRLPLRIEVRAEGFRGLVHEVPVAQLEQPLRLQMAKGNSVTVTVRDPDGAAVDVPVTAHHLRASTELLTPGTTRFACLPDGRVEFRVQFGKRTFSIEHDSAQPEATLVVPRPATLQLAAANGWPRPAEQNRLLTARVQCLDRDDEIVDILQPDRPGTKPLLLLPGRYRVELREGHRLQSRSLGLTAEVTLTAGETTTAVLR